jgi:hypothetical protein
MCGEKKLFQFPFGNLKLLPSLLLLNIIPKRKRKLENQDREKRSIKHTKQSHFGSWSSVFFQLCDVAEVVMSINMFSQIWRHSK